MAHPVQVATVRPGDTGWPSYVGLFADYRAHYAQADPEPEACDRWLRDRLTCSQLTCYLADSGPSSRPAGMALVVVSPASQALAVFWALRDLFVAPDHRRRGIGRALVRAVADDARAAGATRLALQTETENLAAQALYRELGFEDVTGYAQMTLTL